MYPKQNPLKVKLSQDQTITGIYIQTNNSACIEIAASCGYDYVIIDMEHGSFGIDSTFDLIRDAEAAGICPIVRVPNHDESMIRKVVEGGAMGVYVPDVRTPEQAKTLIAATKYQKDGNGGTKGACPTSRATRGSGAEWEKFIDWSNANVMIAILVESMEGLKNLSGILSVPGIDTIVLGRFDIAHELGLFGDRYGVRLNQIFEEFKTQSQAASVPFVSRLKSGSEAEMSAEFNALISQGARIFTMGSDRELIAKSFKNALKPTINNPNMSET